MAGTADPPAADPTPKPSAPRRGHRRIGRTRPGHIHAERRRSRWSVDPRFLAALLVVAVPALATWLIARNDSAPAAAESSPVEAVMPAREDSLNLDALPDDDPTGEAPEGEVDLPDFSEGELVGAWEGDESSAESAAEVDPSSAPDDDAIEPVDVDDAADATPTVEPEPSQGAPVGDPEPSDTEIEAPEAPGAAVGDSTEADAPAAGSIDPASATDEPRIVIDSWTEACRFGPRCLKVGFALEGFESVPAEFVCEFASGARFAFNMPSPTVDFACATGTVGDSITIEVGGVRSETIVHS